MTDKSKSIIGDGEGDMGLNLNKSISVTD
jgi:hypothetical protein